MFKIKNLPLTISTIVVISLIVGWGISMALAWTDPTANPPLGNVAAPINVSSTAQTKAGDLNIGDSMVVTNNVTADAFAGSIIAGNVTPGIFASNYTYGNYTFNDSLSSSLLYIDAFNARVGIKDSTPDYDLDVFGDMRVTGTIYGTLAAGGAAGGWVDDGTIVRLDTDTDNVGIGTTTPDYQLQVENSGGDAIIAITSNPSNRSELWMGDTSDASSGRIEYENSADRMVFYTNLTQQMTIRSDGNVGIGYADPGTAKLAISGNVGIGTTGPGYNLEIQNIADAAIYLEADTDNVTETDNAFIKFSQDSAFVQAILGIVGNAGVDPENVAYTDTLANAILFGTLDANGNLQFGTNDAVRMTINTSGNVGIGTTSPTTAKLVISSSGAAIDVGSQKIINLATPTVASDATNKSYVDSSITAGDNDWAGVGGDPTLAGDIYHTGNVGIGDATPGFKLSVAGNQEWAIDADSYIKLDNAGTDAVSMYAGAGDEIYLGSNNTYQLRFHAGGTILSVKDGVNVGIGTTGPLSKLHLAANNDPDGFLRLENLGNLRYSRIYHDVDGLNFDLGAGGDQWIFKSSSGEKVKIWGSTGLVRIGTDPPNPATTGQKLHVRGTGDNQLVPMVLMEGTEDGMILQVKNNNNRSDMSIFEVWNSNGRVFWIRGNGQVCIGPTETGCRLDWPGGGGGYPGDIFVDITGDTMSGGLIVNNIIAAQSFEYSTDSRYNWMPGANWNTFNTEYGSIQLGPANASWAHIYTNIVGGFYMNRGLSAASLTSRGYIYGPYGTIARSTDEWLRLNDGTTHTNGVYTPGLLRADGGLRVGNDEGWVRNAEDVISTIADHIDMDGYDIYDVDKLTVTTIDPVYEIDGKKYATYVADFAGGVRSETSGVIQLNSGAKYVIDFDDLEKGGDLWLFWETSNKEMDDLVVILSSGFEGKVWYDKQGHKLTIYGDESGEVSYRLTLPRLDDEEWENLVVDKE